MAVTISDGPMFSHQQLKKRNEINNELSKSGSNGIMDSRALAILTEVQLILGWFNNIMVSVY